MGGGFVMEPAYQRVVIDCLNDPDETLKRKVFNLAILVMVHEVVATVYVAKYGWHGSEVDQRHLQKNSRS